LTPVINIEKIAYTIKIKKFSGRMNDGEFSLDPGPKSKPGVEIIWNKESNYRIGGFEDISVKIDSFNLYKPEAYSMIFDGRVSLEGSFNAPISAGNIAMNEGDYTEPLESFIQRLLISREIGVKAFLDYPLVQDLELNVNVQVPGNFRMFNRLVDAEVKAAARVQGSLVNPVVLAQGNVVEGKFYYFGQEFDITRGEVRNKAEINPEYDILAETEIEGEYFQDSGAETGSSQKVQMELKGSLSEWQPPKFTVSGNSNLSQIDIITILTLGKTPEELLDSGLSSSGPSGTSPLLTPAKSYIEAQAEKLLDLKEFKIQEDRLMVTKQFLKQISVLMDVGYGGQQWIGLQSDIRKHVALEGKVNLQKGDWTFDVKLKYDQP